MKHIIELNRQLQKTDFEKSYPICFKESTKTKVIFVAPYLNANGYYRMILPAYEINHSDTHEAIVTELKKWDFTKCFNELDHQIDPELIEWANFLVLPMMFTDVSGENGLIASIKSINPEIQIVMDIDVAFHFLPEQHPAFNSLKNSVKKTGDLKTRQLNLLRNLASVDFVTSPSEYLIDRYESLITKHFPESATEFDFLPNLIPTRENQFPTKFNSGISNSKIRFGIIGNVGSYYDIISLKDLISWAIESHSEKVEFVVFGWNGKHRQENESLTGLPIEYHKSIQFMDLNTHTKRIDSYDKKVSELNLDVGLIPSINIPFNLSKSPLRYYDFARNGIPCIASNVEPYDEVIDHGETGLLANNLKEWKACFEFMMEAKNRKRMGQNTQKDVGDHYTYNDEKRKQLTDIYN